MWQATPPHSRWDSNLRIPNCTITDCIDHSLSISDKTFAPLKLTNREVAAPSGRTGCTATAAAATVGELGDRGTRSYRVSRDCNSTSSITTHSLISQIKVQSSGMNTHHAVLERRRDSRTGCSGRTGCSLTSCCSGSHLHLQGENLVGDHRSHHNVS